MNSKVVVVVIAPADATAPVVATAAVAITSTLAAAVNATVGANVVATAAVVIAMLPLVLLYKLYSQQSPLLLLLPKV